MEKKSKKKSEASKQENGRHVENEKVSMLLQQRTINGFKILCPFLLDQPTTLNT